MKKVAMACDLEVDVNGQQTFFLHKEILASRCGKLGKLFAMETTATTKALKVVLHGLPGGANAFELIARFCYGGGGVRLTPANTCLLHCAAHFLEMSPNSGEAPSSVSLTKLTEKSLEGIPYWTWCEVVHGLKQCQDFVLIASSSGVLDKLMDSLAARITTPADASPTGSSPESSSGFRFSFDTRSTLSMKIGQHRTWWFDDLTGLDHPMIEKATKTMISHKLDHATISRFLFSYLKLSLANASSNKKRRSMEIVVDLLYSLDRSSVPCKSLFGILRVSLALNMNKWCRSRLESMIGFQIDQVSLDNLLVPATKSLYDVDLVLRFLKFFLDGGGVKATERLKKAGSLMDLYLTEVAPDSGLKPFKFAALAAALPDAARDSHDALYRALDIYLEVHAQLSEEEKTKICCPIKYEKLSSETCNHLAHNAKFPSRTVIQALISQHSKLKNLLKDTTNTKGRRFSDGGGEQVVLYVKKLDLLTENEKLRENLNGMQCKVRELEKVCRKLQVQMAKMGKSKMGSRHHHQRRSASGSLPKLCS